MKCACITFDEIHCRTELEYNDKHDHVDGVDNDGQDRLPRVAHMVCCFIPIGNSSSDTSLLKAQSKHCSKGPAFKGNRHGNKPGA